MGYTPLPDLNTGDPITAADWNIWMRDNFAASPAALAQAKGDLFPAGGADMCVRLPAGADGQIVEYDAAAAGGLANTWGFIPVGGIILWAGLLASLPANWQLCDGTNGTPNLRDEFIIGAGGTYAAGATGGAATANLQHNHGGSLTGGGGSDGDHTHTSGATNSTSHTHSAATGAASASITVLSSALAASYDYHTHTLSTGSSGHTHAVPTSGSSSGHGHTISGFPNQLSTTQDMRPPYYALAYIQRMS